MASPVPLPNAEFMAALRKAAGRRFGLPASRYPNHPAGWQFYSRVLTELETVAADRAAKQAILDRVLAEREVVANDRAAKQAGCGTEARQLHPLVPHILDDGG